MIWEVKGERKVWPNTIFPGLDLLQRMVFLSLTFSYIFCSPQERNPLEYIRVSVLEQPQFTREIEPGMHIFHTCNICYAWLWLSLNLLARQVQSPWCRLHGQAEGKPLWVSQSLGRAIVQELNSYSNKTLNWLNHAHPDSQVIPTSP